jgi:uncharacterized protein GlcG (DUF336 family)
MDTVSVLRLTKQGATKVMEAALKEAEAQGRNVSVAVVDDAGQLIVFARTDKAGLNTIPISQAKARCAARTRHPSGKLSKAGNERTDHHCLATTLAAGTNNMVTMPGGHPIKVKDQVIGAVAVSGAGHHDGEIAEAAAGILDV